MELLSMTDFVELMEIQIPDELNDSPMRDCDRLFVKRIISYSRFLKQPLKLEMFVPCDEEENVLDYGETHIPTYQKAKEKVLFEGFTYISKGKLSYSHRLKYKESMPFDISFINVIVEDYISWNLTLTPSAQLTIK